MARILPTIFDLLAMTSPHPRRWSLRLAACAVVAGCSVCSVGSRLPRTAHGPVVLEVRGAVKGGPYQLADADLAALGQRTVRGVDPAAGSAQAARFTGVDLAALLGDHLELTGDADTVVFHTADLMEVPVPLSVIRQLRPTLADRADDARLEGNGARLVAWPNVAQPGVTSDPRAAGWWAHRVTALEVVSAVRTVGRALALPEAAPAGARAGAALYGERCLACHRLRAVGGRRGPELTRVTGRVTAADLRRKLQDHPGWHLPGQAQPTAEAAAQLDTFLRTVAAYDGVAGAFPDADADAEGRTQSEAPEPPPGPPGP